MPLRPSRIGKAAVVTAAVTPGPSPVAKAAVVGAAVAPGPSPVAKAAVVGAAVTPGPSPSPRPPWSAPPSRPDAAAGSSRRPPRVR